MVCYILREKNPQATKHPWCEAHPVQQLRRELQLCLGWGMAVTHSVPTTGTQPLRVKKPGDASFWGSAIPRAAPDHYPGKKEWAPPPGTSSKAYAGYIWGNKTDLLSNYFILNNYFTTILPILQIYSKLKPWQKNQHGKEFVQIKTSTRIKWIPQVTPTNHVQH